MRGGLGKLNRNAEGCCGYATWRSTSTAIARSSHSRFSVAIARSSLPWLQMTSDWRRWTTSPAHAWGRTTRSREEAEVVAAAQHLRLRAHEPEAVGLDRSPSYRVLGGRGVCSSARRRCPRAA